MRLCPLAPGLSRRVLTSGFLALIASAAATAPVSAAGPSQLISKQVELKCSVVTPYFTVPDIKAFATLNATVPASLAIGESGVVSASTVELRIPQAGGLALQVATGTYDGTVDALDLALTRADPATLDLATAPIAFATFKPAATIPPAQELQLHAPAALGTVPDSAPFSPSASAQPGDVVDIRLASTRFTVIENLAAGVTSTLPFDCDPQASVDNLLASVQVTAAPQPTTPMISSLTPNQGSSQGGDTVTISGTGLADTTSVTFGGAAAPILSKTDTLLKVTVPAHDGPGTVPVVVTSGVGTSSPSTFSYFAPPVLLVPQVKQLAPDRAIANWGGVTVVSGSNLDKTTRVSVGPKAAQFIKVNKTTLIVVLPALKKGSYDLTVKNAQGASESTAKSRIRYLGLW